MSKQKPSRGAKSGDSRRVKSADRTAPAGSFGWSPPSAAAVRETVESVVIAFVLAFLFRTFEAEAFVIPTGSMAPTLMGRHKDVTCPICGHRYRVSASEEVDSQTGARKSRSHDVVAGTCPMCRYTMDFGPDNVQNESYPSFKGDRILVGKFAYQFADPERWDVAVFKYPGNAQTNFIKRIVGLPEERLQISRGDVFTAPLESSDDNPTWAIARKPPRKLLAMLQPVFDNDCIAAMRQHQGWPDRWRQLTGPEGAWRLEDEHRAFSTDGTADGPVWVRYQHLVPTYEQWSNALARGAQNYDELVPSLISDFCAYNTGRAAGESMPDPDVFGLHWVGDLALECRVDLQSEAGEVVFELVEGGRKMQCRVDVATGEARLTIDGQGLVNGGSPPVVPTATTDLVGPGRHDVRFSNCDDQLLLWVDGDVVEFEAPTTYDPLGNITPSMDDLAPVGVASHGVAMKLSRLKIYRDLYYSSGYVQLFYHGGQVMCDFTDRSVMQNILVDPRLWEEGFQRMAERQFTLKADQFLALGDNSAKSKDSRLWEKEHFVSRELLIGKAIFIYWPHSWHRIPGTPIPFPFFPNFPNMGFVR